MHAIRATPRHTRAAHAVAELLEKLRIDALFVGTVARAAWLDDRVESGAVDVLAMMNAQQKNQVAMMASNRGFRVEREELEQAEELDLIPLHYAAEEGEVRVHVLLASNALYGRMMRNGVEAAMGDRIIRVPAAEDLALLLLISDERPALQRLVSQTVFDHEAWQERLASLGLEGQVAGE